MTLAEIRTDLSRWRITYYRRPSMSEPSLGLTFTRTKCSTLAINNRSTLQRKPVKCLWRPVNQIHPPVFAGGSRGLLNEDVQALIRSGRAGA